MLREELETINKSQIIISNADLLSKACRSQGNEIAKRLAGKATTLGNLSWERRTLKHTILKRLQSIEDVIFVGSSQH